MNDDEFMVERLIAQGANPNLRFSYDAINYTPFLMAGVMGKTEAFRELLRHKVDFKTTNYYGGNALTAIP